jgi:hypothetical protein
MMTEIVKMNKGSIQEILIEDMNIRKFRARMFLEVAMHDHKMKIVNASTHNFWTVRSEPRALAWPSYFWGKQTTYPLSVRMFEPQSSCGRLGDKSVVTVDIKNKSSDAQPVA